MRAETKTALIIFAIVFGYLAILTFGIPGVIEAR